MDYYSYGDIKSFSCIILTKSEFKIKALSDLKFSSCTITMEINAFKIRVAFVIYSQ